MTRCQKDLVGKIENPVDCVGFFRTDEKARAFLMNLLMKGFLVKVKIYESEEEFLDINLLSKVGEEIFLMENSP